MQIPKWIIVAIAAIAALAIAELAGIMWNNASLRTAEQKIERLTDQLADVIYEGPTQHKEKATPQSSEEFRNLELKVAALKRRVDAFETGESPDMDVEEIVDRKLGQKLMSAVNAFRDRKIAKQSLSTIAKKLDLTESQKGQFAESVSRARDGILELATIANAEDGQFLGGLNKLIKQRMPPLKKAEILKNTLATRSLPDSEESYLEALIRIRDQALDDLDHTLTDEQMRKFKTLRVSPFTVRVER